MRIAAVYDIHGNLPALEAVLEDVCACGVDEIVVGGDVFPGPMPSECLDLLLSIDLPVRFLHGNGDRTVREFHDDPGLDLPEAFRDVIAWNAEQLSPEQHQVIASWPSTVRASVTDLGEVLFCHATPRNDTEIFTRATVAEAVLPALEGCGADVVLCGHTHMQFDRIVGPYRLVNAGSVGMPHGSHGAFWALLGPSVELRRVPYDLDPACEAIGATGYPGAEQLIEMLQSPRPESEMVDRFTAVGLKAP